MKFARSRVNILTLLFFSSKDFEVKLLISLCMRVILGLKSWILFFSGRGNLTGLEARRSSQLGLRPSLSSKLIATTLVMLTNLVMSTTLPKSLVMSTKLVLTTNKLNRAHNLASGHVSGKLIASRELRKESLSRLYSSSLELSCGFHCYSVRGHFWWHIIIDDWMKIH